MIIPLRKRSESRASSRLAPVGQGMVEFALILPIFLLLVWGVFEFGRVVFVFSAVNNASREAARYGAATGAGVGSAVRYLDCAAIRQHARETAFLAGLSDTDIQIGYDRSDGSGGTEVYAQCGDADLDAGDVALGDRIVVTITRQIAPIIPFLPVPEFSPTFVTARTILKDIVIGPLECSDGVDNDGDGRTDYDPDPAVGDSGCTSPDDTTEALCYSLTLFGQPTEGGNLSHNPAFNCANRYVEGFTVHLAVDPDPHYAFDGWNVNGTTVSSAFNTSLVMDEDKNIIAQFHRKTTDLSLWKNSYPEPIGSGETLNYYLEVTNDSITYTDTATSVVITDTLPAEVSVITDTLPAGCTHFGGSPGGTVVCALPPIDDGLNEYKEIQVTAPVVNSDTVITNTATVSGFEYDPDLSNNAAERPATVIPLTDLVLNSKTSSPGPIYAGDEYTYTIEVGNLGPSLATGVVVTDTLEGGVSFVGPIPGGGACSAVLNEVTCEIGTLDVGATATVSFTVKAPDSGGNIDNVATVGGDQTDRNLGNNSNSGAPVSTTFVRHANLEITKSGVLTATRDQPFAYLLTVTNKGPSEAVNVEVTDSLPAGLVYNDDPADDCTLSGSTVTCLLGTMIKNETRQINLSVTPTVASPDPIINTATVGSGTLDQSSGNNEDSASTTVVTDVELSVSKSASPAKAFQDEPVDFNISVTNNGESVANDVTVVDALPEGFTNVSTGSTDEGWSCSSNAGEVTCTLATLAALGGTADFTITATPTIVGNYTNNVSVTSAEMSTPATGSAPVDVAPSVDLGLTKSGPATAVVGDPFNYTIDVFNYGPSTATGVTIVDTLPTGVSLDTASSSCDLISPGEVACAVGELIPDMGASVTLTVTSGVTGTLRNRAEVTANEHELSPGTRNVDIHDTEVSSARAPQTLRVPTGDAPNTAWFSGRGNVNKMSLLLREHLLS